MHFPVNCHYSSGLCRPCNLRCTSENALDMTWLCMQPSEEECQVSQESRITSVLADTISKSQDRASRHDGSWRRRSTLSRRGTAYDLIGDNSFSGRISSWKRIPGKSDMHDRCHLKLEKRLLQPSSFRPPLTSGRMEFTCIAGTSGMDSLQRLLLVCCRLLRKAKVPARAPWRVPGVFSTFGSFSHAARCRMIQFGPSTKVSHTPEPGTLLLRPCSHTSTSLDRGCHA